MPGINILDVTSLARRAAMRRATLSNTYIFPLILSGRTRWRMVGMTESMPELSDHIYRLQEMISCFLIDHYTSKTAHDK